MNLEEEYILVQKQINSLKKNNNTVPKYLYEKQYNIVKNINDTFEKEQIEDIEHYAVGIRQNMMLKYFAEKIGRPVEEFKTKIRNYYYKLTGEEISDERMNIKD